MVRISWQKITVSILRNQFHHVTGGPHRGGYRTTAWLPNKRRQHAVWIFDTVLPHVGLTLDRTGLEIGPGDNLDVCRLFLDAGCRRVYAVDKYAQPDDDGERVILLRSEIEEARVPEVVDFAYSNDAFEHVTHVPSAMGAIFRSLRPGGRFVASIDLRGHNAFGKPQGPLDFLTCPDWLWRLMYSHVVTTNRVRVHEFIEAAEGAGFIVLKAHALAAADHAYLDDVRPDLLPRYRELPADDLRVLQLLLVLERPDQPRTS